MIQYHTCLIYSPKIMMAMHICFVWNKIVCLFFVENRTRLIIWKKQMIHSYTNWSNIPNYIMISRYRLIVWFRVFYVKNVFFQLFMLVSTLKCRHRFNQNLCACNYHTFLQMCACVRIILINFRLKLSVEKMLIKFEKFSQKLYIVHSIIPKIDYNYAFFSSFARNFIMKFISSMNRIANDYCNKYFRFI